MLSVGLKRHLFESGVRLKTDSHVLFSLLLYHLCVDDKYQGRSEEESNEDEDNSGGGGTEKTREEMSYEEFIKGQRLKGQKEKDKRGRCVLLRKVKREGGGEGEKRKACTYW